MKGRQKKAGTSRSSGQRTLVRSIIAEMELGMRIADETGKRISVVQSLQKDEQQAQRGRTPLQKHRLRYFGLQQSYDEREWPLVKDRIEQQMSGLRDQVNEGQWVSLMELALTAARATTILNELAAKDPRFVAELARHQTAWPILATVGKVWYERCSETLAKIQLGEDFPFRRKSLLMGHETAPRVWAVHLWETLAAYETARENKSMLPRSDVRDLEYLVLDGTFYIANDEVFQALKAFQEVQNTPPTKLWPLAQKLFLDITHGRPWEFEGLSNYAEADRVKARGNSDNSKKNEVVKHIRQAFFSLVHSRRGSQIRP